MSISYSGIVGKKANVTLPSVEVWNYNSDFILKDPPKGIQTRRIDKVGQTMEIIQMIQDSGDRAEEGIRLYALGVNPFVSVDYNNNGNNGGQRSGNNHNVSVQASLPYKVNVGGAFRPPIRDIRENYALSRLPRTWTSSFTKPGFTDFSKKLLCQDNDQPGVKKPEQLLKACVQPTITYQIQTPFVETYEVSHVIKNPTQVSAFSGFENQGKFNADFSTPTYQLKDTSYKGEVNTNLSDKPKNSELSINTSKYTKDTYQGNMMSNMSNPMMNRTPINFDTSGYIKDINNIDYQVEKVSYPKYDYSTTSISSINMDKVLPTYQAQTNIGHNIHKQSEFVDTRQYEMNIPKTSIDTGRTEIQRENDFDRSFNLKPTLSGSTLGSFDSIPTLSTYNGDIDLPAIQNPKNRMRAEIYNLQQERLP